MNDAFYDFEWTVAPEYEWQDWLDGSGARVVVPADGVASLASAGGVELAWNRAQKAKHVYGPVLRPIIKDASKVRHYYPMQREHAALFREFADLDYRSTVSLLAFARRYGALGLPMQTQSLRIRTARGELRDHHAHGEPFLDWAIEICFMREGLRLGERKRRSVDDYRRLKRLFDRNLQHVQGRLGFDRAKEPKLMLEPLTLLAAMWLQLALAVTGEKEFVACKFCHRLFEISTEQTGFRSHREFCSDSCKTKDYRKRKRTALRLATSGVPLGEISEKTATETATVRSWLTGAKRGERTARAERE
jgi:hypothetical protein